MSPKIQIVVPCYEPSNNWTAQLIKTFKEIQNLLEDSISLILVNDGSNNSIKEADIQLLQSSIPFFQYFSYPNNKGKGFALRKGVEMATAEFIIVTDIDFPYTNQSLIYVYEGLREGNDLAIGQRNHVYYEDLPLKRILLSKVFRWTLKNLFRLPTDDSQCGLKGFNRRGKEIFQQTTINRFLYDLEFLVIATQKETKIKLVDVYLKPDIEFTSFGPMVLLQEIGNLFKILLKSFSR